MNSVFWRDDPNYAEKFQNYVQFSQDIQEGELTSKLRQNKLYQEDRPLKQFIELQFLGEEFVQNNPQAKIVWDGIDEGFVGLRIDNCASIILEL